MYVCIEKQTHTHTHTQGRGKGVLTQRHTTTPLKNHGNFLREGGASYTTHNTLLSNVGL